MNNPNWHRLQKRSSIASESPFSQQNFGMLSFAHLQVAIVNFNIKTIFITTGIVFQIAFTSFHDPYDNTRYQYLQQLRQPQPVSPINPQSKTATSNVQYSSFYQSRFPLYGLDWSNTSDSNYAKIAVSSYREDTTNRVKVIYGTPTEDETTDDLAVNSYDFERVNETVVNYPVTRLQWDPSMSLSYSNIDRFATTSECLRIYEVSEFNKAPLITNNNITSRTYNNLAVPKLIERAALTNSKTKNFNQLPPVTSFDWNYAEPKNIISCSIDTTCTLWDLSRGQGVAKTQLIAHDSEVFDVKFIYGDKHVFASCSSDGSIRVFDLRYLEHSTIIYEPQTTVTNSSNNNSNSNNNNSNNNKLSIGSASADTTNTGKY
ncbi:unnamed protein product [Ambrosiozyma monospora]|uniref:Unnamed protein product n=1 Tax=Ambrosiozyma monospora TaxID=43982 RepID=A0ACB5T532_AMBMO|nr:unnamed protein product [Ambrosiozyma monospora]